MDNESKRNNGILDRANAAILSRDFEQAARIYKGLLKSDPQNIELLSSLGNLYVKSGDDEKALAYFSEIIRIDPKNVEALNSLGGIYRRLKKYDDSISVLEQAVISDESNVQSFYNLGFTFKLMGKYDDALNCFNRVVEENPEDVLAFNHIGSIYALKNQNKDAVSSYLRGLKIDPNHPILHLNLAKSYDALGEFEKAQSEYEAALKTKPGWLEAIENYADLLLKKNKTRNAGELVRHALNLNPKDAAMHTKLGDVYTKQSDFDNAEVEYNEALKIRPEFPKALSGLASAYESTGRNEDALEIMGRMENASPEDSSMLCQYAHILLSADRIEEAGKKIQCAYEKNPDDLHVLNLLGQYYICIGDERKASGCFKKIKAMNSGYSDFYREGGMRYSQKGDLKKAEEFYLRYIAQNPENVDGLHSIAKNYEAQGNLTQAMSTYRQIEKFDSESKAWKNGIERINKRLLDSTNIFANAESSIEDEFGDADENFEIGLGEKSESPEISYSENEMQPSAPTEIETEPESTGEPEHDFENLQNEEVAVEEVFSDGKLDAESEDNDKEKYSHGLDNLVPEEYQDEDVGGLEEDETSAEDFFAQNPFSSGDKSSAPKENSFEPDFETESFDLEEEKPDVISIPPEEKIEKKELPKREYKMPEEKIPAPQKTEPETPAPEEEISEPEELIDDEDFSEDDVFDLPEQTDSSTEDTEELFEDENLNFEDDDFSEEEKDLAAQEFFMESDEPEKTSASVQAEEEIESSELSDEKMPETVEEQIVNLENSQIRLFKKLKSLCRYLPEQQKKSFLESKTNLQLEYIISRLSGNKGLFVSAENARKDSGFVSSVQENETGIKLLLKVILCLKELVNYIQDEQISTLLSAEINRMSEILLPYSGE